MGIFILFRTFPVQKSCHPANSVKALKETQGANVTDSLDRQDRGQTGQRSDSIGRTVLQTVAQKPKCNDTIIIRYPKLTSGTVAPSL